jgi:hypothetical protein
MPVDFLAVRISSRRPWREIENTSIEMFHDQSQIAAGKVYRDTVKSSSVQKAEA